MSAVHVPETIDVAHPPSVAGLTFRHAGEGDWDALADVGNAARRGDGVDEIRTGESLRAEYGHLDEFRIDRDVIVALVGERMVGYAMATLVEREGCLVGEMWGAVR